MFERSSAPCLVRPDRRALAAFAARFVLAPAVVLAAAAVLGAAPSAAAQLTEAQAVKQAHAASKAALADFKQQLHAARDAFIAAIEGTEATFKAGAGSDSDLTALFDGLQVLQAAVQQAVADAGTQAATGVKDALAGFADGADLDGDYPVALQLGTGGVLDDTARAIDKQLDKTYAALDKRLDKLEKRVAAQGSVRLAATVGPPGRSLPTVASESFSDALLAGFDIDALWAHRDTAVRDAGTLQASGPDAAISVGTGLVASALLFGHSGLQQFDAPAVAGDQRWTATLSNLPRGSYVLSVEPVATAEFRGASFGMP